MITNKWVLIVLGLLVTVVGYLSTVDWTTMWPSYAGMVVMILGVVKAILATIMPAPTQPILTNTGKSFFTHT